MLTHSSGPVILSQALLLAHALGAERPTMHPRVPARHLEARAVTWLRAQLVDGPMYQNDLYRAGRRQGLSPARVRQAARALGVEASICLVENVYPDREACNSLWHQWRLPQPLPCIGRSPWERLR